MNEVAENVSVESQTETQAEEKKLDIPSGIIEAFNSGIDRQKEEDNILIDMLQAGAPFKKVKSMFTDLMIEAGLALSREDKESILASAFEGKDLSVEEDFDAVVKEVNDTVEHVDEKGAMQMIRAYARKNDIEYFKKPKGPRGTRITFINDFYGALLENPKMTEEEVHDFLVENGTESMVKLESTYQKVRVLCNDIAEKYDI